MGVLLTDFKYQGQTYLMLGITIVIKCLLSKYNILSAGVGNDLNIVTLLSQCIDWFIRLYIPELLPVIYFYLFISFNAF